MEKSTDRRRPQPTLYVFYALVILLLGTLLVVGFFHYSSLSASQKLMISDLQQVRQQYVQLQTYITGQTTQDIKMEKLQADLVIIKKLIVTKTGKKDLFIH